MKKVAMIGVGKLGQDCAEVMASAGHDLIGYDIEPRFPEFKMASSIQEAVSDRDIIFIAAPTPHECIYGGETPTSHLPNKDFDYAIVKDILTEVNKYANQSQLVVLISTVLPGTVRSQLRQCITNARFIYNPYLIAMGTIKWDMVNPEMIIIGTEDGSLTGDAKELIDFYTPFMENNPRYEVGTWDEAECIKIFYNTFISTKLALVNMIQDVAERNENINVDVVTTALANSNYRITGPAYMKAGLGDAGACHPRDNIALRYLADRLDLGYDLFDSIMRAREVQAENMARRCLKNGKNITIVGKAYKPKVHYTNGSASLLVGHYIEKHGGQVNYYDIHTGDLDLKSEWTDVYLIGYYEDYVDQLVFPNHAVVIDPWRKYNSEKYNCEYIRYGDSRPAKTYFLPEDEVSVHLEQTFLIWPEMKQFQDQIECFYFAVDPRGPYNKQSTEAIVEKIRNAKKQGKNKFLFQGMSEGFIEDACVKLQRIAKILEGEVSASDLFYLNGSADGNEVYEKVFQKYNWNSRITTLSTNYFEWGFKTRCEQYKYTGLYNKVPKPKKFLCFNKVHREHRLQLLDKVLGSNLLDSFHYSFEGETSTWQQFLDQTSPNNYPNIFKNKDIFPLKLNLTEERPNPVDLVPDDIYFFNSSLISVVTETLFYKNNKGRPHVHEAFPGVFFSEKIYKPIVLQHPFILVSTPGSLKKLREQGYRTFHPYIDETYDTIEDDDERLNAIFNEIKAINSMPVSTVIELQEKFEEIVRHNKQHFFENTDHRVTKDIEHLFRNNSTVAVSEPSPVVQDSSPIEIVEEIVMPEHSEPIPVQEENELPTTIISTTSSVIDQLRERYPDLASPETLTSNTHKQTLIPMRDQDPSGMIDDYHRLKNGWLLKYPKCLNGGGNEFTESLLTTVMMTRTKKPYNKALEWCSGHGILGYHLLSNNVMNEITFVDYYDLAVHTCLENALMNNIVDRVNGYTTDNVGTLPEKEKFDLVISNPPHVFGIDNFYRRFLDDDNPNNNKLTINNTARLCLDSDLSIHRTFFENIKSHLEPGADIYLLENDYHEIISNIATENGLTFIAHYVVGDSSKMCWMHFINQ